MERQAEALVREFLLFRGFTHTVRTFEAELAGDVTQGYQVDRIIDLCFNVYVPRYEIEKLVDLMAFLTRTLFAPADAQCQATARKLDISLKKYYIVYSLQKGRPDRVVHLFENYGDLLLHSGEDLHAWFAIPYTKNPSTDPRFQIYFTKDWLDTLMISFRNFLCQFFDGIRLPALLKLVTKGVDCGSIKRELNDAQKRCSVLQSALQKKEEEILQLKRVVSSTEATSTATATATATAATVVAAAAEEKKEEYSFSQHILVTEDVQTSAADDNFSQQKQTNDTEDDEVEINVSFEESYTGHSGAITRCRFSSSGSNIASASIDGTVRIWTYDSDDSTPRDAHVFCGAEILSLDWEPRSDRLLLLGTAGRGIRVWNVDARRIMGDFSATLPRILDMKCSPTEPIFVTAESSKGYGVKSMEADAFGHLGVWNMKTWSVSNTLPLGEDPPVVTSISFNHNGKMIAAAANDGMIRLFDVNGCLAITGWPAHDGCSVTCVRFSPNQSSLFTLGSDGQLFEWSLHNQGQILRHYDASKYCSVVSDDEGDEMRHEFTIDSYGSNLLLTSKLPYAPIYNLDGIRRRRRTEKRSGRISSVDWHPFQHMLLTGSFDHSIHV